MIIKFLKRLSIPTYIFIFSLIILNTYIVLSIYNQKQISKNLFRFHIVANSNSVDDQITKLKINEDLKSYLDNISKNSSSKEELEQNMKQGISSILNITNTELKKENKDYTAYAKIGNISYDEKINTYYDMPAGNYDSVQIVLGKGQGKNIFSLLFPNESDEQNLEALDSILPGISNIYGDNNDNSDQNVQYSFKILELLNKL